MNPVQPRYSRFALLVAIALAALLGEPRLQAQAASRGLVAHTVPELFVGELDDVGPQFLLQARPSERHFEVWTDWDYSATSNVTLESSKPVSSTLLAAQAGVSWRSTPRALAGGSLTWETGIRVQGYRYGFLANSNHPVNFIEIDRNNFDLGGANAGLSWRRNNWLVTGGVRGATLRSRSTNRRFYEEFVGDVLALRQWTLRPTTAVAVSADAARRWTRTDSFGLLPDPWNDRLEVGVVASAEQRLGPTWRLQPSFRVQYTHYTHADHARQDRHLFFRVSLVRPIGDNAEVRLSVSQEQRESSDGMVPDYHKWDAGLGGSARWRF